MNNGIFEFVTIAFVAIVALISHHFSSKKAVIKHNLKKFPQTRIADFKEGEIGRITGKIIYVDTPLKAPLSGRKCSHYYVCIEEKGKDNRNIYIEEEITGTVVIQDGEYYALIESIVLDSYIVQDRKYNSGTLTDASPHLEAYLNKHGYESVGFLGFNKSLHYKEGVLEEDERVTVAGLGEWKQAKDVGLPESYGKILVMRSGNDSLYLSDARDIINAR